MNPAYSYFTSSTGGGATRSTPVAVDPQAGTMSLSEWWIDGDIGIDAAGNLYATWDTQGTNADGTANDIGWLSYSTDAGKHWSAPIQALPDTLNVPHIMEVAGGGSGVAHVSWLSNSDARLRRIPAHVLDRAGLALAATVGVEPVRRSLGLAGGYDRYLDALAVDGRPELG